MKIYRDLIQGTTEWKQVRCGVPTASQFHRIVTPSGGLSKSAPMYMLELLAERITGEQADDFESEWMQRGSELEAEAVNFYQFTNDVETEKVGFILDEAIGIGCSPDRLVGDVGMLEVKTPKPAVHVGYLLQSGAAYKEHRTQVQAQLWIANREWNDLLSYNPTMPPAQHRFERDAPFLKSMEEIVATFCLELERQWSICVERGWVQERRESPITPAAKVGRLEPLEDLLRKVGMSN